jgi:hypothetical protein
MDRWYQVREEAIEEAIAHAHNPDAAILAAFTVLDDWFSRGAAEVNTLLRLVIEFGPGPHRPPPTRRGTVDVQPMAGHRHPVGA